MCRRSGRRKEYIALFHLDQPSRQRSLARTVRRCICRSSIIINRRCQFFRSGGDDQETQIVSALGAGKRPDADRRIGELEKRSADFFFSILSQFTAS